MVVPRKRVRPFRAEGFVQNNVEGRVIDLSACVLEVQPAALHGPLFSFLFGADAGGFDRSHHLRGVKGKPPSKPQQEGQPLLFPVGEV